MKKFFNILFLWMLYYMLSEAFYFILFVVSFVGTALFYDRFLFHHKPIFPFSQYMIIVLITCPIFFYFFNKFKSTSDSEIARLRDDIKKEIEESRRK